MCEGVCCNFELGGQGTPMEKLASEKRLAVPGGISHVGMRRRILDRGNSLYKGPEADMFLEKKEEASVAGVR